MKTSILTFDILDHYDFRTNFENSIKAGVKIHSFEIGLKHNIGDPIQFMSSAKHKGSDAFEFFLQNKNQAESWHITEDDKGEAVEMPAIFAIENFTMKFSLLKKGDLLFNDAEGVSADNQFEVTMSIGSMFFDNLDLVTLVAFNDGFNDPLSFIRFYFDKYRKEGEYYIDIKGQLVHWTNQVYDEQNAEMLYKRRTVK